MPEHIQYEDDDLFNRDTHHEASDVPIRPLFVFIVIFIVFAFFTHFLVFGMFKLLAKGERVRAEAPFTKVERPEADKTPQQPLLQPFPKKETIPPYASTPVIDLVEMRRAEDKVLHNYGWVDKQKGTVHMPIETAKELAVQRLNAPPPPPVTTTTGGAQ